MADRVTKVTLTANVAGYIAGMDAAAKKTQELGTSAEKLNAQKEGLTKLGTAFAVVGGAAAVGVGAAVVEFSKFSAQMAQVQTLAHATQGQMTQLSNAALTMGQGIGFSATQVADAESELVKAGVSVKDIMGGGLKGALDLAAAGQIDVANATSIAAAALTQFGLNGSDVPHVADLLAAGADKALGGVTQLGQALGQSGLVAHQFGLTVDDTVGTLAEFAQAGLLGSDAGTSLKQMFLQLASPSTQAQKAMAKVGFSAYDAQGKFIGITKLAGELHDKFGGMSDAARNSALSIIFGSDAIRAATILYKDGAKGNQAWINSVDDSGFAATQAAGKMNSLEGDLKKLESAFQTGLIKSGSAANGVLRGLTQEATGLVSAFSNAPKPVQDTVLAIGGLTAAVGLSGAAFLVLVPKIAEAKTAMATMSISAKGLATSVGKGAALTIGLAAIAGGLSNLGATATLTADQLSSLNAAAKQESISDLNKQFSGGGGVFDVFATKSKGIGDALNYITDSSNQANINVGKFVDGMGHITHVSDTVQRFQAQFAQLGTALSDTAKTSLPAASAEFNKLVSAAGGGNDAARKLLSVMPDYKAQLIDLASAQGKTVNQQQLLNLAQGKGELATEIAAAGAAKQQAALDKLAGTATTAKGDITDLEDAIKNFGKTQFDVDSATRSVYDAIDTFTKSLKDNGKTLDVTTQKGRDNQQALEDIASSYLDLSSATLTQTGSTQKAAAALSTGRDQFIKQAEAVGLTAAAATDYANRLGLIPANVTTAVSATGVETTNDALDKTKQKADALPKSVRTQLIADKTAAEKNLEDLKARLITVPVTKKTSLLADIAAAEAKIRTLKGELSGVPSSKSTTFTFNTGAAEAAIQNIAAQINNLNASAPATAAKIANAAAQSSQKRAGGGYISGPGTSTSDSIPAMLSDGEYVVKASAVDRIGVGALDRLNNGYANGGLVGFASGGSTAKAAAAARKRAADAAAAAKALAKVNSDQFSFLSDVARGNLTGDNAVNDLYSVASTKTNGEQISLLHTALSFDKSLTKLTKSSDAASQKLSDLQSASSSLSSSVQSAVGNPSVQYSSASGLKFGLGRTAANVKEFAGLLTTLQKKGVAPALLSEIAQLGSAQGLPLARSLSNSAAADIKSINASYAAIGTYSAAAGKTVADANYKAQIAAADRNARLLQSEIARQSKAIQKIIGHALKVPGYSTGGYTGPARVTDVAGVVHGQEFVVNARATAANRAQLERMNAGYPGYASGGYVRPVYVRSSQVAPQVDVAAIVAAIKSMPRGGDAYTINEVTDTVGTAMAIARRQKMRNG